ncbi:MAG: hypothetical protein HY843_08910, partial [Bdellovibrio sp.]|nr:hypothetical protein [Bdellovibrio sp.]
LPPWFLNKEPTCDEVISKQIGVAEVPMSLDYQDTIARFEKEYLKRVLGYFRGRINKTARETGINKTTLIRRIRSYNLL